MLYMVNLGLFENNNGIVTCIKMLTRTDEYTAKLIKDHNSYPDNLPTISRHCRDKVRIKRREEKRREENKNTSCRGKSTTSKKYSFSEQDKDVAIKIWELIEKLNIGAKQPNIESWATDVRLMVERDGRTHADVVSVFTWANQDPFWASNVLSPQSLRKNWPKLVGRMRGKEVTIPFGSDGI